MNKTTLQHYSLSFITALVLTGSADAATVWVGGVDNNWNTAGNWSDGVPDTAGETVTIGNGFTVNATTDINLITYNVNLQGTLNYGSGFADYNGGTGSITVSGNGKLWGVPNTWITPSSGNQTINLVGASAQIGNFYEFGSFTAGVTMNWNFTPGETGINAVQTNLRTTDGTDNLSVDLSGYNTANGDTLTLFSYGSIKNPGTALIESVVINGQSIGTNLGTGTTAFSVGNWGGDLVISGTSVQLQNLAWVPEPSSTALLGLGGFALALRRRRS